MRTFTALSAALLTLAPLIAADTNQTAQLNHTRSFTLLAPELHQTLKAAEGGIYVIDSQNNSDAIIPDTVFTYNPPLEQINVSNTNRTLYLAKDGHWDITAVDGTAKDRETFPAGKSLQFAIGTDESGRDVLEAYYGDYRNRLAFLVCKEDVGVKYKFLSRLYPRFPDDNLNCYGGFFGPILNYVEATKGAAR